MLNKISYLVKLNMKVVIEKFGTKNITKGGKYQK